MTETKSLAFPNSIIWQYYECLKRQINRIPKNESNRIQKQEIVLTLFLSVSIVEVFINAFFRVIVDEKGYEIHKEKLLKDFEKRISLENKLKEWPKRILGKQLNFNAQYVKEFITLKDHRNALMHFIPSHESIELPGPIYIHGLADMSAIETLSLTRATEYPDIIRNFSYEIFLTRGIKKEELPHAFHQWFGEPFSGTSPV